MIEHVVTQIVKQRPVVPLYLATGPWVVVCDVEVGLSHQFAYVGKTLSCELFAAI